jgi:hypothetical protein
MFKIPPTKILFCYTVYQPLYDEMKKEIPLIEFHQGLPTVDTLTEWGAIHGHKIVVLDDLMMDAANSDEIVHLMYLGSHHHQISHTHITKLISKGKIHENCFSQLSLFHFNGEQR